MGGNGRREEYVQITAFSRIHRCSAEASNRKVFKDREIRVKKGIAYYDEKNLKVGDGRVESAKGKLPDEVIPSSVEGGWCPAVCLKYSLEHQFESKEREGESNP